MTQSYTPGRLRLRQQHVPIPWDPYGENVSLLLHGDGANGSTTIVDSSPSPKIITAYGNAQISTAESRVGGGSIAFDGSGDYGLLEPSSDFVFGVNNFTIEAWIFPTQITARNTIISSYPNATSGNWIFTLENGKLAWYLFPNLTFNFTWTSTSVIPTNQWSHVALTRASNTWRLFYNGSLENTATETTAVGNLYQVWVGSYSYPPTAFFNGYIDELRITKGVARYTSNFTPSTEPFPDIR